MSRTDAHTPWWVVAPWYEPWHFRCPYSLWGRDWSRECTLPDEPVREQYFATKHGHCHWSPMWPSWRQARWRHIPPTPKWFVDHHWNNPERVRERDQLGKMVKEFNATGMVADGDFANYRGRHGARWAWD